MNAVVFEHVSLSDLPAAWRSKLPKAGFARKSRVTVRIEQEEVADAPADKAQADLQALMANPMFGMWADRKDMADVGAYIRTVRAPRLNADGTRRKN
jgi:hypothetical protein